MGKNKKKNNSNNDEISDSHIENEIKNTEDCISTDVKQGTNGIIDLKQSTSSMDKKKQKKDKSKKSLDKKNTTEQASTETEEVEEVEVVLDDETDLEMEDETQEPSEIIISKEKYDELIKQIEDANKRYEELFERFQRVQADFENYKKYLEKEKQEAIKYASGQLIRQLLNIIDDFERAINSMGDNNNPVLEGIRSIYRNFYAILEKEGLKPIECTGKFDPFKQEKEN
ncbi:MAG: nucleotide exchange factor GrpE [Candidatus Helarchaeota archaeon]